jgi:hypothetical protein
MLRHSGALRLMLDPRRCPISNRHRTLFTPGSERGTAWDEITHSLPCHIQRSVNEVYLPLDGTNRSLIFYLCRSITAKEGRTAQGRFLTVLHRKSKRLEVIPNGHHN